MKRPRRITKLFQVVMCNKYFFVMKTSVECISFVRECEQGVCNTSLFAKESLVALVSG